MMILRRDLWRFRSKLPHGMENALINKARSGALVEVDREIGDGEGNVVDIVAWVGNPGDQALVRLPARCFETTNAPLVRRKATDR